MYRLERISLHNWGRLQAEDIEIRGAVALLGPTGAGKSTVIDAIQVAMTGASSRFFQLNKATGGHSTRSVRDYCLGLDDHISAEPARAAADTLVALSFRDGDHAVSFGVMLSADLGSPASVRPTHWFVARGHGFRLADHFVDRGKGRVVLPENAVILDTLKRVVGPGLKLHHSSQAYVEDYLVAMRRMGAAPDPQLVLRNLKETVAFKPIENSTDFVRRHILEPDRIDVGGLKGSIATYRFFDNEVKERERQLAEVKTIRSRLQTWARQRVGGNVLTFRAAHAERRRLGLLAERARSQHQALSESIETERQAQQRGQEAVELLRQDLADQQALLRQSPGGEALRQLDEKAQLLEEARGHTLSALARVLGRLKAFAALDPYRDRIAFDFHDALGASIDLAALPLAGAADAAMRDRIERLERRIVGFVKAAPALERQVERLDDEIAAKRQALAELDERLAAAGDSGAVLSRSTQDFLALLAREGIGAQALPDIVEVAEPAWAMALEMMLGAYREALIVPRARLSDAFGLLYRERHRLDRCRLVDVRKTDRVQRDLPERSLARIIATANRDAEAFIRYRVGHVVRIESEAELAHHDHAITRQGKTVGGMALGVHRDLDPILGRTAQDGARRRLREQRTDLAAELKTLTQCRSAMQAALQAIAAIGDEGADAAARMFSTLAQHEGTARAIARARDTAEAPEVKGLREEIAAITAEIAQRQTELKEETAPLIAELELKERKVAVELMKLEEDLSARVAEEEQAVAREAAEDYRTLVKLVPDIEVIAEARHAIELAVTLHLANRDPGAVLATIRNEAVQQRAALDKHIEDNHRRATNAYFDFVRSMPQQPLSNPSPLDMLSWTMVREQQLEEDELRKSRTALEEARLEMELALKEGLLNRLAEKTGKVRRQIARLNANLVSRRFTGQTYEFTWSLNLRLKAVHNLARAVSENPDRSLAELIGPKADPQHREAFDQLEALLLEEDDALQILEDYREHFDFDLKMTNANGHETTLSKRSATGSGGQKQAPYYVAIAAAMAAAYYPHGALGREADGMGLVIFDEAFNNLDTANTTALMRFFEDLHLQVIVAAPDRVRSTFLEIVDTIVTVRRSPATEEPVLSVSHISERARLALASVNPVHKGVEAFRDAVAAE